ncbi:Copia protein, partial [Mucuna pruriens]
MSVEFVVCFEASNHGIWLRNFVTSFWVVDVIERSLKIYCDNNSTVFYSNNNRSSTKSKFIDIKFLVVKERFQNKHISIEHIGTSFMLVDPLTKGLIPKVEIKLVVSVYILNSLIYLFKSSGKQQSHQSMEVWIASI